MSAMPVAESTSSVKVTLEFKCADGKVKRVAHYGGSTAVKVANMIGDLLDLATKLDALGKTEVQK